MWGNFEVTYITFTFTLCSLNFLKSQYGTLHSMVDGMTVTEPRFSWYFTFKPDIFCMSINNINCLNRTFWIITFTRKYCDVDTNDFPSLVLKPHCLLRFCVFACLPLSSWNVYLKIVPPQTSTFRDHCLQKPLLTPWNISYFYFVPFLTYINQFYNRRMCLNF